MDGTRVVAADRRSGAAILVVGVRPGARGEDATAGQLEVHPDHLAEASDLGVDLTRRLARVRASGRRGELTWIDLEQDEPQVLAVVGLGKGAPEDLRAAGAALARRGRGHDSADVLIPSGVGADHLRALAEGIVLGGPLPTAATSTSPGIGPLGEARLITTVPDAELAVAHGVAHAEASMRARRLVQTPGNRKGPAWLAEQAIALAGPVETRSLVVEDLARLGMGGLLAVGRGSARPPRLVTLGWQPSGVAAHDLRQVVLVGKGITFDSGGISLKPPEMQMPMKTDMTGAAVVVGVISALSALGPLSAPGVRVTAVLCLAENLPGAAAMRPGDVVRHHGGLTSEVLNTDAEGRLVLGDGLAWAVAELGPDVVVDVATLTGAATLGLGRKYGALFANRPGLAEALRLAGDEAGEPLWQMPLHEPYRELISSEVADQANADVTPGPGPGAITAALFLQRFVGDTPWAHLDVAGPARSDSERLDVPKGGTGFGVRALLRWLEAGAPA